jgi:hypothetical protein
MPRDEINIRVVFVASSLFLFFAFLIALAARVWGHTGSLTEFLSIVFAAFLMEGGIALVGYLILLHRESNWREKTRAQWQADFAAFMADQEERVSSMAVQCPTCEQLAMPLANSDNCFRCNYCEKDFEDQHHGVLDIIEYKRRNPDGSDGPYPLTP